MIQHSPAYDYFMHQLDATGREKCDGYDSGILDKIYDWEREEVEYLIWNRFNKGNDVQLAPLVARLEGYDGIEALKDKLKIFQEKYSKGFGIVTLASELYRATDNSNYLLFIFRYYEVTNDRSAIAVLSYLKPCKILYDYLVRVFIDSEDEIARTSAVVGILYAKGYIKNPFDNGEFLANIELVRELSGEDPESRKQKIELFEKGGLEAQKK